MTTIKNAIINSLEWQDFTDLLDRYLNAREHVQVNHGPNYDDMIYARNNLNEAIRDIYSRTKYVGADEGDIYD